MYVLISSLIDPLAISFTLLGIALVFAWWRIPDGRKELRPLVSLFLLAWLACSGIAAHWAARALEWPYPPLEAMPDDADAIVVLSGGAYPPSDVVPWTRAADSTVRRCRAAAKLYHTRPCPVIACGGKVDKSQPGDDLAEVMRRTLIELGVDEDDILLESSSTDTYENAAQAKAVIDQHGFERLVLVTDAIHLYRSSLCFRQFDVDVIPAGAHHYAGELRVRVQDFFPRAGAVQVTNAALHEAVGLTWYKLRGRI